MLVLCLTPLLLSLDAPDPPGRSGEATARMVSPFLGESVVAVVRVDLERWDARALSRSMLGPLADEPGVVRVVETVVRQQAALRAAGAKELDVLVDPASLADPVAIVPLVDGAKAEALVRAFIEPGEPIIWRWTATRVVGNAVVAGPPDALNAFPIAEAAPRPGLAEALSDPRGAPLRVAVVPGAVLRRSIEEGMAELPKALGGGPITDLTRGLSWASLTVETGPKPSLNVRIQARDAAAASTLSDLLGKGLGLAASAGAGDPTVAAVAAAIGRLQPRVEGDRVSLDANLADVAGMLAGPVRQANAQAQRSQGVNQLKQIGLAMHNYLSAHDTFPPAFRAGADGKPLLSWRVLILPYLEEKKLFDEFHLDEPWDSPHNKALIPRMPKVYASPAEAQALVEAGKTTYLTPRGPHTILHGAEGVKIRDITDGTSMTVFTVDAGDALAVTWTRPDDWNASSPDETFHLEGLFGHFPGGTSTGFADGSVRFLKDTLPEAIWKALMTRDGGEILNQNDF